MKRMTREEWERTHPDFRGVRPDGTHVVNDLCPHTGATVSVPVEIMD
jgi:hypothetical protein